MYWEWGGIDIRVEVTEVTEHVIGRTAFLLAVFGNSVAVCRSFVPPAAHLLKLTCSFVEKHEIMETKYSEFLR